MVIQFIAFLYPKKGQPGLSPSSVSAIKNLVRTELARFRRKLVQFRRKFDEVILDDYPTVQFQGLVDEDGAVILLWKAPSADIVREIIKEALGDSRKDWVIRVKRKGILARF